MEAAESEQEAVDPEQILHNLGYAFNSNLQLRHVVSGKPFEFINQGHYEEVANAVAETTQKLMLKNYGMKKYYLPLLKELPVTEGDGHETSRKFQCPIFLSSNINSTRVVLILLSGSGKVMAGHWARSICINESLREGSVIPFLEWAKEYDFGVVVLNPNMNQVMTSEGLKSIPFNGTSDEHVLCAWDDVIMPLPAKKLVLIAHSYGGANACNLLYHRGSEVLQKLRCVAFTDSVHGPWGTEGLSEAAQEFMVRHTINWVASKEPLGTPVSSAIGLSGLHCNNSLRSFEAGIDEDARSSSFEAGIDEDARSSSPQESVVSKLKKFFGLPSAPSTLPACAQVSAGTDVHEKTTMTAFPSICKYILSYVGDGA